jgi:hypothetical protein
MISESNLAQWPVELFDQLPERVTGDILSALEYSFGERSLKHVLDDLYSGEKQIWLHSTGEVFTATVITQIVEYPSKRTCEVTYLGGDGSLDIIRDKKHVQQVEEWARYNQCQDIQIIGRKGWLRVLKDQDYTERYITLGKQL